MKIIRIDRLFCVVLLAFALLATNGAAAEEAPAAASLDELEQRLRDKLEEHKAPGAGVALVLPDGRVWARGVGLADRAPAAGATAETVFRVGSISKSFVSLTAMKLVERGELDLQAELAEAAPEVEFENRYDTPVRLVHLLEHTAGFDDIHLAEYAADDPDISLEEALAFHPDSRWARWEPGQHYSYSNSGPVAVAYAIQKQTGRDFEEVSAEEIFEPMGLDSATWRAEREAPDLLAQGHRPDGATPAPFAHIIMRPSGALSMSAADMGRFVKFMVDRGRVDGRALLSEASIERIETPTSTRAARRGIETGYGLGNYSRIDDGFVFRGHDGGITGFVASYLYLPGRGGFAVMLNAPDGAAMRALGAELRAYLLDTLEPPEPQPRADAALEAYAGYYEPMTVRPEFGRFGAELFGMEQVAVDGQDLSRGPVLGGKPAKLVPVGPDTFRLPGHPVPTVTFFDDGTFQTTGVAGATFRRVSPPLVWTRIGLTVLTQLLILASILFALVWGVRRALGKLSPAEARRRVPTLIASLLFYAFIALISVAGIVPEDPLVALGTVTPWSVGIFALSLAYAGAAAGSFAHLVYRARRDDAQPDSRWTRVARAFVWAVGTAHVVVMLYLFSHGLIGLRMWAL